MGSGGKREDVVCNYEVSRSAVLLEGEKSTMFTLERKGVVCLCNE